MRLRARILTIGLATALAASGCGAEDSAKKAASSAKDAIDPVAQAADATSAKDGGMAVTLTGKVSAAGQDVPLDGSGVIDRAGKKGTMSLKTSIAGKSVTIDEIIDGHVIYMGGDLFGSALPGGKKWVKLDLDAEAAKAGVDLSSLGGGAGQDPTEMLEYLKGAGASRKVGTATVNGTRTTQYHVDVDLRKAAAKSSDPDKRKNVEKLIKVSGVSTIPIDVWVDDQHLVRRERVAYSGTTQGQKTAIDMTIDFTKFGVDVDAKTPPADEVVDAAKLLGAAGATQSS